MTSRDGSRSGTGVFYQAMPAVGADGRNIMKLIPVKMVNGHYVASPALLNKDVDESQLPITLNFNPTPNVIGQNVPLVASGARPFVIKPFPLPTSSHKPGTFVRRGSEGAGSLNKRLSFELPRISPKPSSSSSLAGQVLDRDMPQLPVTVKSPVLPNGQYIQIPPNAQVRSLPASALPPAIKKKIFSVDQFTSNSKLPNVLYVSPVTSVHQCATQPGPESGPASGPAPAPTLSLKRLSRASGTLVSSLSSHSKGRGDRERPHSPMKWVIEEEAGSSGSCLVPVKSSMADILHVLSKKDDSAKTVKHAPLQPSSPNAVQQKDNALVMYSGKVYFVSKKFDFSPEPQVATVMTGPSSLKLSPTNKTKQDKKTTVNPVVPDEVIDLCDDDPLCPAAAAAPGSSASQSDEDNVIFVSYVPPASGSGSANQSTDCDIAQVNSKTVEQNTNYCQNDLIGQGAVASLGGTNSMSVKTCKDVDSVQNKLGCPVSTVNMSSGNVVDVQVKKVSPIVQLYRDGSRSEATIKHASQNDQTMERSEQINARQPTENTALSCVDGGATPTSPAHSGSCVQIGNGNTKESCLDPFKKNQTSVTGVEILHVSDRQLKKMFGITSDVKVCLTKVDGVKAKTAPVVPLQIGSTTKHTLERIRKLIQEANIARRRKQSEMTPTKNDDGFPGNSKKLKMAEAESTVNSPSVLNPPTDTLPQEQTKSLGSPSSLSEIIYDYEEPINEDVISTPAENQSLSLSPAALGPLGPDCVLGPCCAEASELNLKPRRRGRPKRCTVCPCGAPDIVSRPTHANVVKQKGHRSPRNSACAVTTPGLKNEGTPIKDKSVDERVVPMVIHSPPVTSELNNNAEVALETPVSSDFHTLAMDAEEILSLERIERLKKLLKEKESDLEMIRNNK